MKFWLVFFLLAVVYFFHYFNLLILCIVLLLVRLRLFPRWITSKVIIIVHLLQVNILWHGSFLFFFSTFSMWFYYYFYVLYVYLSLYISSNAVHCFNWISVHCVVVLLSCYFFFIVVPWMYLKLFGKKNNFFSIILTAVFQGYEKI